MAGLVKQVGGRAVSYLTVRRGRPPAFYEDGRSTTKRYTDVTESRSLTFQTETSQCACSP